MYNIHRVVTGSEKVYWFRREYGALTQSFLIGIKVRSDDACMDYKPLTAVKTEVPMDFPNSKKSGNKTSSGEIGLNIIILRSPKVGQDQVSGGVSVLCWHSATVAYILWKPHAIRWKSGNKVKISNRVKIWCNLWSVEGVTVYAHHPQCRVTFERVGSNLVW